MSTNLKIRQLLGPLLRSATTRRNLFRDLRSGVRNLGVSAAQRRVTDECATQCVTDSPNSLPLVPRVWYPCRLVSGLCTMLRGEKTCRASRSDDLIIDDSGSAALLWLALSPVSYPHPTEPGGQ